MAIWIPYVGLPILDYILPVDHENISEGRIKVVEKDRRFLIPLYMTFVMDLAILIYAIQGVGSGRIGQTTFEFFLYVICSAQTGALNAVVGHELIHRRHIIHKICGSISYAKMMYGHFFIQHIRSHHKKVATPEDPSTSRLGESLYQFYWRAIPAGYVEVFKYEQARLSLEGCTKWWQHVIYNRLITFNLAQGAWLGIVYLLFGQRALVFHICQSALVTLMFEAVNYLEHYGLLRKKLDPTNPDSAYESVKIIHSWNAPQVGTSYLFFKLQRHSDHHANAYKPYQILDSFVESPMLPYGYSVSLILCVFPYIWKRAVDPVAITTNKGEKITEEQQKDQNRTVLCTLLAVSLFLTWVQFFYIGFNTSSFKQF
ncbi:hypothetical protein FGO68_gene17181 [Halteria grandinella]|uniref:Fatty acid desaturase domain-containing protein n=1 Tax=Halteria grandinella TaxID=5974 RepID=A0A8J8NN63_HALGN|nr:hypothetical protein FGO68_gene17181 [Halteria grandinella]